MTKTKRYFMYLNMDGMKPEEDIVFCLFASCIILTCTILADQGQARGCSTNIFINKKGGVTTCNIWTIGQVGIGIGGKKVLKKILEKLPENLRIFFSGLKFYSIWVSPTTKFSYISASPTTKFSSVSVSPKIKFYSILLSPTTALVAQAWLGGYIH